MKKAAGAAASSNCAEGERKLSVRAGNGRCESDVYGTKTIIVGCLYIYIYMPKCVHLSAVRQ